METIIQWIGQNIAASIAILISTISLLVTMILNRREKPNIMPAGENVSGSNHLSLDFLNTSEFNIHNLTILINVFDAQLNEINNVHIQDKYLFSIGEKTKFHYGWILGNYAANNFYFRVRFCGNYNARWPIFYKRRFCQPVWYSVVPIKMNEGGVEVKIMTTHKDEIEKLEAKHATALRNYECSIDKRFK